MCEFNISGAFNQNLSDVLSRIQTLGMRLKERRTRNDVVYPICQPCIPQQICCNNPCSKNKNDWSKCKCNKPDCHLCNCKNTQLPLFEYQNYADLYQSDEDENFISSLIPYIKMLQVDKRMFIRNVFQDILYLICYKEPTLPYYAPNYYQNGLNQTLKIPKCAMDLDTAFFHNLIPMIKNLPKDRKLLIQIMFLDALQELLDENYRPCQELTAEPFFEDGEFSSLYVGYKAIGKKSNISEPLPQTNMIMNININDGNMNMEKEFVDEQFRFRTRPDGRLNEEIDDHYYNGRMSGLSTGFGQNQNQSQTQRAQQSGFSTKGQNQNYDESSGFIPSQRASGISSSQRASGVSSSQRASGISTGFGQNQRLGSISSKKASLSYDQNLRASGISTGFSPSGFSSRMSQNARVSGMSTASKAGVGGSKKSRNSMRLGSGISSGGSRSGSGSGNRSNKRISNVSTRNEDTKRVSGVSTSNGRSSRMSGVGRSSKMSKLDDEIILEGDYANPTNDYF